MAESAPASAPSYIEGIDTLPDGRDWDVRLVLTSTETCSQGGRTTTRRWDDGVTVTECSCGLYKRHQEASDG